MRRVCQVAGLCFLALSLFVVWKSFGMKYYSSFGPGPGFFPFWLGTLLAVLSAAWVIQVTFGATEPMQEGFIPNRAGKISIVAVLIALILVTWLMEIIGFCLTMFVFQLFLLAVLGKQTKELAGKHCYEFMHEAGRIPAVCPHQQLLADHRTMSRV